MNTKAEILSIEFSTDLASLFAVDSDIRADVYGTTASVVYSPAPVAASAVCDAVLQETGSADSK